MGFSAYSVSTINQLQSNLLYSFQNFQNTELNLLPVSDLYHLLVNQPQYPSDKDGDETDFESMQRSMENGFKSVMSR